MLNGSGFPGKIFAGVNEEMQFTMFVQLYLAYVDLIDTKKTLKDSRMLKYTRFDLTFLEKIFFKIGSQNLEECK